MERHLWQKDYMQIWRRTQIFALENLATPIPKNSVNVEENRQKLRKILQDYEDRCKMLGIPAMIERYEYRRNRRNKRFCYL